jgi:hypothetical protein
MTPNLFGFIVAFAWFAVFLVAHLAILRATKSARPTRVLLSVLAATTLAAVVNVAALEPWGLEMAFATGYAVLTTACLFVVYSPFFYSVFTSLSIQSLIILLNEGGEARVDYLFERFALPNLFDGRLNTMIASGYLVRNGDRFHLTPKAAVIGRLFRGLKSAWRLGAGG